MGWWNGYPNNGGAVSQGHYTKVIDTGLSRNITISDHTEFIRPTFLMLFCTIPFLCSLILIEILHYINRTQHVACSGVSYTARFLRRKPWIPILVVSKYSLGERIFGIVEIVFAFTMNEILAQHAVATGTGKLNTTKYFNIIGISFAYLCIYNMAFLLLPVSRNSV
ncbi:hypothetical protein THRCLA_20013 [Thraustotheca clavata]|uniref:Uncharacterized protein n=1 Tax=Thraustotheca clavata TaxID=74557 RepID=A0A1W0ACR1_9STRA|nr:hypothetical protein THRCLA_20013 [Thraustotheca clavata]